MSEKVISYDSEKILKQLSDTSFMKRESRRSYLDKPVPQDVLERLFERIRWTPSCNNNQPWRFIFVSDPEQHAKVAGGLSLGNEWAAKAPILIAPCARQKDDYSREDDPVMYYQFDTGMAVMSLLLGAADEGLMAHPMAGYDAPKIKAALSIPDEFHVMCMISLGYKGPIDLLDERTRKKDESPRVRKPVNETIALNKFMFKVEEK
ncbi:MAG: nitroreductase family protein [candidate division Zixibacteria bacterium]|nr:nitroreductase family protein [candidate division Zixibacteria bacterium]